MKHVAQTILESRRQSAEACTAAPTEAEGGCGVTGLICSEPVNGRHVFQPSIRMHNRGNGKGGGIAAVGISADQLDIDQSVLEECYLLHIALLDTAIQDDMERRFIDPHFSMICQLRTRVLLNFLKKILRK